MRAIIIAVTLTVLLTATSAVGLGLEPDSRESSDTCAENNAGTPFSCFALGTESTPVMYYVDTGRHDGVPGIWQEDNSYAGLQKEMFYAGKDFLPADMSLLG